MMGVGVCRVVGLVAVVRAVQQRIGRLALQEGEALDQLRDRLQASSPKPSGTSAYTGQRIRPPEFDDISPDT